MKQIATMLALFVVLTASSQSKTAPLTIGDQCPDISFAQIVNGKPGQKLSNFRNRHLVICFVSPLCGLSETMFPKLEQLQKQFAKELQIILVAQSTAEQWNKLKRDKAEIRDLLLPMVLNDTLLQNLFPHKTKPHTVWLDQNRNITAITDWEYITPGNIRSVLAGQKNDWPLKKDAGKYNPKVSLLALQGKDDLKSSAYSMFTGQKEGTPFTSAFVKDSSAHTMRHTLINLPIVSLFRFSMKSPPSDNHFIYEVNNKDRIIFDSTRFFKYAWNKENTFCYEAVLPLASTKDEFALKLRQDLETFLGYRGSEERRKVECYVLSAKDSSKRMQPRPGKARFKTISDFVEVLNLALPIPVVDETGIITQVNLPRDGINVYDIESVKQYAAGLGLNITLEEREIKMFVIKEK